jgi:coenzyme Q-binding protein COQ10
LQRTTVTKILPYAPDQLFALVGEVRDYPEFVPWVTGMRTWNTVEPVPGVSQVDAEAEVRFAFARERFATRVRRDAGARRIDVNLLYGPFRRLVNRWDFREHPAGTEVEFLIEFEFKSRLLEKLLAANAQRAAERIMQCFEARAKALYAPAPTG